jgi:hypothetical protein
MEFEKIAPYLQDPLVLIGFMLLLFFGFARTIVKAGLIPQLTRNAGYRVISKILLYGFLLAFAIIALGFGLKYRELSQAEQERAVLLLHQELAGNLAVVVELQKNIATIRGATDALGEVLRHPGIPVMSAMFPAENIDVKSSVPVALDYSRKLLADLRSSGLTENELELNKFNMAADAIVGTIGRTKGAISSLSDTENARYVLRSQVWDANLPILRKIEIVSVPELQNLYQEMQLLRTNYNVIVAYSISYVETLEEFFGDKEKAITEQRLAAVLASERLFAVTEAEFSHSLSERLRSISAALLELEI